MTFRSLLRLALAAVVAAPAAMAAQRPVSREAIVGEYAGTLTLDSGPKSVNMVFALADSVLSGRVLADGEEIGAMEHMVIRGDSIFFKVDRFEFSGQVTLPRIQFSMLMWNGVTRRALLMTRRPNIPKPPHGNESGRR